MGDFVSQPYAATSKSTKGAVEVRLEREGALWFGPVPHRLAVRKIIHYKPGSGFFTVDYSITNRESAPVGIWFGVEMSIGLMAGDAHDRYYKIEDRTLKQNRLKSIGEEPGVKQFSLVDEWLGIETSFRLDKPATFWRFPIETVSLSEAGFEKLFQCSVVTPNWRIHLENEFSFQLTQSITKL
jgi:alpha-amylase